MSLEIEHTHQLRQIGSLVLHRGGCCGSLLDQRGILLSDLIHLRNGVIDLFDTGALLLAGSTDFTDDIGDSPHTGDHLLHRRTGLLDQLAAGADFVDRIAN